MREKQVKIWSKGRVGSMKARWIEGKKELRGEKTKGKGDGEYTRKGRSGGTREMGGIDGGKQEGKG